MPVVMDDYAYGGMIRITGNTLFRWLKEQTVSDVEHRDGRGSRLCTLAQVGARRTKTNHALAISPSG
jgi:hypothetical protein